KKHTMKNIWMIAGGLALMAVACTNVDKGDDNNLAKGTMKLTGEIKGMDTGYIEFLYPIGDSSETDSVEVKKGKFEYALDLTEPTNMIFRVAGTRGEEVSFFADPGKLTLKGDRDSMWATTITGGPTQITFRKGEDGLKAIMAKGESLYQAYMAAQAGQNFNEMARIETEFNNLQNEAKDYAHKFAFDNRNSVVAAYYGLVYLNEPGKEDLVKSLYDTLTPAVKKSFFGGKLAEVVESTAKTAIGEYAPDFTQNDANGNPVSLSSLRGKYLLLDFWASWCQPCRQENPNIVKAYNTYKDKGFDILGVSLDQDRAAWLKAITDDQLTWNHVSDLRYWENAAAQAYGIRSIPASYLLDKEGRIIAKNLRGAELEAKLAELMP
ncbi:MAG TPA: TlpA disulfide reductase family protein, partial [Phnomibacter sp.]|nr:TlpA disulfide reductase family protein [Phnomibacter sp.]